MIRRLQTSSRGDTEQFFVVPVNVAEINKDESITLQAKKKTLRPKDELLLFIHSEFRGPPDSVEVEVYPEAQARQRLKLIGMAMHNFHSTYDHFPPAIVYGPDGKPWHSWRVLLLPYLEQNLLYNEYDFNSSWDSPKNLKVLERMPNAYRDPTYKDRDGTFTHYAAITGPGTAFPLDDVRIRNVSPLKLEGPGLRVLRDFKGKLHTTILVGPVSPDRKIPWTKPEDVVFGAEFPHLGEPGGFATPHTDGKRGDRPRGGLFVFETCDVRFLTSALRRDIYRGLMTISGNEVIKESDLPETGRGGDVLVITIDRERLKAHIEWATQQELINLGRSNTVPPPDKLPSQATQPTPQKDDSGTSKPGPDLNFDIENAVEWNVRVMRMREQSIDLRLPSASIPDRPGRELPVMLEGFYLGFMLTHGRTLPMTKLFRAVVTEVHGNGLLTIDVGPSAAREMHSNDEVLLLRPRGATTAQLRALPDLAPIADREVPEEQTFSRGNLKHIGLALHKYHDARGQFPPAVVYGPDGKPWHSWRVLILPFLEDKGPYAWYDFKSPWDSQQNEIVLKRMPDVFRDPINGDTTEPFTHYAAATGPGMAFSPGGHKMAADFRRDFFSFGPDARSISDFSDGTSFSIMVGPVSPERKIAWTKPQDVSVGADFPGIDKPAGFAAPHKLPGKSGPLPGGLFLFADGTVKGLPTECDPKLLRALLTINSGEILSEDDHPWLARTMLKIEKTDRGLVLWHS